MQPASSKKAFILSACLHVFVLIILIASLEFSSPMPVVSNTDAKVVNAIALKDSPVLAPPTKVVEEIPKIQPQTEPVKSPPPQPRVENKTMVKPVVDKPAKITQSSQAPVPEKKLAIANEHKNPAMKQKNKIMQKDLSKQLLADLEDEIAKQAKAKQKQIKNKFSQELKLQSEKALEQLLKEQKQQAGLRPQHRQGVIDKYKALILQAIGQQWIVPNHASKHLVCELLIRLAPGGIVLEVQVMKSSGDILLDRSARAAVFKASPLPVPDDIYSFEPFRQFVLKVRPENVLENKADQGFWIS